LDVVDMALLDILAMLEMISENRRTGASHQATARNPG